MALAPQNARPADLGPDTAPLRIAIPSKGRLQDQTADWFAQCGFTLKRTGGGRAYTAELKGLVGAEVLLLSAREIALGVASGDIHLGVTGEDLIREECPDADARVSLIKPLGFGHADVVVAVPAAWIDVATMDDLEAVAAQQRQREGRQLRVATKFQRLTRAFFAEHGFADYRIVESHGATEGAPAAGQADVIVDITSTGATLTANHLKILDDGVILKSEAHLAGSLSARWDEPARAVLSRLLDVVEAREAGAGLMRVEGAHSSVAAAQVAQLFAAEVCSDGVSLLAERAKAVEVAIALRDITKDSVTVTPVHYVFEPTRVLFAKFVSRLREIER